MTNKELAEQLQHVLDRTLDEGPGPRRTVRILVAALVSFIWSEAGGYSDDAAEEAIALIRTFMEKGRVPIA